MTERKKKADKSTTHFFQCTLNISNMCTIKLLYLEEGCLLLEYILLWNWIDGQQKNVL